MAGFPKIPGCKILSELGEGGMAIVYLGIQENLNRRVAIKVPDPKLLKNEITAKRFKKEAEAAAKLSHSNIIQIIDVGKFRNHYYIIMEYLVESVKDRMKDSPGGKIDPQTALEIVQAIIGALEFAHSRKIYHRDIKPDNIMFREDNTPVLVDFGVARIFDATDAGGLTKSGQSMGTVSYMRPKQCAAQKDVDVRGDIYSLGAVLYEMLTGKRPYEGDTMVSVALKHINEKIPTLPKELREYQPLIKKMMAKNRKKRISSEAQFQKILDKIMASTANYTRQSRESLSPTISKTPRLNPTKKKLIWGVFSVVLVVLIFVIIFSPGPKIKKQEVSYNSIYTLFVEDLPYYMGLNIVRELYKKGDSESLKGAHELINKLKGIKITPEINELEEKITNRIESGEEFNKYLADARDYFKKKNFSKARENISLAKQIKTTPDLVTFEEEVKKAEAEEIKILQQKDDKAYELASSKKSISAYQKYLDEFPKGLHAREVANMLNKLREAERKKRKVTLRSQYEDNLNDEDVQTMIKKYKFFNASWNKNGAFKSYYEKKLKNRGDVVIAYKTGLIWYNGKLKTEMNLEEAEKWVEKLNGYKYGGYDDWRLPTLEEAASLLIKGKNTNGLHIDPIFLGSPAKIWTNDHAPKKILGFISKSRFWLVCFDTGNVELSPRNNKHHVRPVRLLEKMQEKKGVEN